MQLLIDISPPKEVLYPPDSQSDATGEQVLKYYYVWV